MKKALNFNDCVSDYIIWGDQKYKTDSFDFSLFDDKVSVYEIVRLVKTVPLFWEDHWLRMVESADALAFGEMPDEKTTKKYIQDLVSACSKTDFNIKLVLFKDSPSKPLIYISKHYYPTATDYKSGVSASFLRAVRRNPNIKTFLPLRQIATEKIKKDNVFDVILINHDNVVTEGSRTNFFVIKDNQIYTAPSELVLKGITRKYILQACDKLGFTHLEIPFDELFVNKADICFFSGTSPKILPISQIGDKQFNVDSEQIRKLMLVYDQIISDYIAERKPDQ